MELILKALKRDMYQKVLLSGLFVFLGFSIFVWNGEKRTLFFYIGWSLFLFGMFWFPRFVLNLKQINDNDLIKLLSNDKQKVVWVYSVLTQRMPFGLQIMSQAILYFKLIDGKEISLEVPEKDLADIMLFLNQSLPHASFGYTQERAQWYLAEPTLLLREED